MPVSLCWLLFSWIFHLSQALVYSIYICAYSYVYLKHHVMQRRSYGAELGLLEGKRRTLFRRQGSAVANMSMCCQCPRQRCRLCRVLVSVDPCCFMLLFARLCLYVCRDLFAALLAVPLCCWPLPVLHQAQLEATIMVRNARRPGPKCFAQSGGLRWDRFWLNVLCRRLCKTLLWPFQESAQSSLAPKGQAKLSEFCG